MGKTGRRVAQQMQNQNRPVRAVSRSTDLPFDWNHPSTWEAVLRDVGAIYITYQPDLAVPGAVETVKSFAETALSMGVRRMVLLSGRGEEEAQRAERALQDTGADWTIVRASWFAQNFSESFLLDAVLAGEVALPVGKTREPFIDADDIADVVTASLIDTSHIGQLYEVTGPRLLTFQDAIGEIATATGRDIRFTEIPANAYESMLKDHGVPSDYVSLVMYLLTTVLDGRNEHVSDGVQRAIGREPRDFSNYAREAAASGMWKDKAA